ncbi:MAG: hypothetical protein J5I93_09845 [Pirellulaceae bacterium]|nr:hypothetical protein [Pirellulaceae bacterium]
MPDPHRHSENRNLVEKILNYIPGFHGYLQKDYRRESDHLARTWLADRLQAGKRGLDDFQRAQVDAGQLDRMTECERLRSRLDAQISQIRYAVRGYSGFFDYVRVDENLLEQVYQLDMELMKEVEEFASALEQLGRDATGAAQDAVSRLIGQLDSLQQRFARRGELLKGLGQ